MLFMKLRVMLWLCVIIAIFIQSVSAQQWPQWRGPNRDGLITSFTPPAKWPEKLTQKWKTTQLWHNPKIAMYLSSPVLDGDLLYGFSHLRKGQFFCLDVRTGEIIWATEGRETQNASALHAQKVIFLLTNDADLIVANKSTKGFEPIARYKVADSPTWAHPVILDQQILIKDASGLTLWSFE